MEDIVDNAKTTTAENLKLAVDDADRFVKGWNTMFQQDSDDDSDNETSGGITCNKHSENGEGQEISPELAETTTASIIKIQQQKYHIMQADSCFGKSGDDTTGHVLWGASICLGHYLSSINNSDVTTAKIKNKIILELGCGGIALPSMILSDDMYDNTVFATDASISSLNLVKHHLKLNNRNENKNNIKVVNLDWIESSSSTSSCLPIEIQHQQIDIIMASDIIYGISAIPSLVNIINVLNAEKIYIATRDGRRGIKEFLHCCEKYDNIQLIETITFTEDDILSWNVCADMPDRWRDCNHTIYTFGRHQ